MGFNLKRNKDKNENENGSKNKTRNTNSFNSFQIVDDKDSGESLLKRKRLIKNISIVTGIVLAISVAGFIIFKDRQPSDYDEYKTRKEVYTEKGIDYSYEDFQKDKKAIAASENNNNSNKKSNKDSDKTTTGEQDGSEEIGGITNKKQDEELRKNEEAEREAYSEATKTLLDKNDEILEEKKEETFVDTTSGEVKRSIINQVKTMNTFIDNHVGFDDKSYGKEYTGVKNYIDSIVNSMSGDDSFEPMYGLSVEQTQAEVRYSILENIQYHVGNGYTKYNKCLKNWMKIKHPAINSIQTITFVDTDYDIFDSVYFNNLDAIIVSNGVKYRVNLASQVKDDGTSLYKVLDIKKI